MVTIFSKMSDKIIDFKYNKKSFCIDENKINEKIKKYEKYKTQYTYKDHNLKLIPYNKLTINQLKYIAIKNNLRYSGNKNILINKIIKHYEIINNCIIIQKYIRRYFVKIMFKLHGPYLLKNKNMNCVNITDFYTLEPIEKIHFKKIFSFKENDFIYCFNIFSLLIMLKKNENIENPYNRVLFSFEQIKDILKLKRLIKMIYVNVFYDEEELECINYNYKIDINKTNNQNINNSMIYFDNEQLIDVILEPSTNTYINIFNNHINQSIDIDRYNILINRNINYQNIIYTRNTNINTINTINTKEKIQNIIKNKSIYKRIIDLFIEIDLLGNYTQYIWFYMLELNEFIKYYKLLKYWWNNKMTPTLKNQISPNYNPFIDNVIYDNINKDDVKKLCLNIMETFVYSSDNIDNRKTGTFIILSLLTIVSYNAKINLSWLYENVYYLDNIF